MKCLQFSIIIPAHNEEKFIGATLKSLVDQTLIPKQIVVVNDNSNDATYEIVKTFEKTYDFIEQITVKSSTKHEPGSKVINAFQKGFLSIHTGYDIICKFDADLIFPQNYLEKLSTHYTKNPKIGMAGGFCYIKKESQWQLENLTNKDHIRGALKSYRKECFEQIGGLVPEMGWDTVDEIKASYYGWEIKTDPSLKVKHLKPTGAHYQKKSNQQQGIAFYRMHYGFLLTLIASVKLAFLKNKPTLILQYMRGYFSAKSKKSSFLITASQGKFLRKSRWKGIKEKILR